MLGSNLTFCVVLYHSMSFNVVLSEILKASLNKPRVNKTWMITMMMIVIIVKTISTTPWP